MKILSIDTSTDYLCLGFGINDELISEISLKAPKKHSQLLPQLVNNLLEPVTVDLRDIDIITLSIGPGSYTGLRISTAFVQGLALSNENLRTVCVDSLTVYAQRFQNCKETVAVAVDARSKEIYGAVFDVSDAHPTPIIPSGVFSVKDFVQKLNSFPKIILMGNYANKIETSMKTILPNDFAIPSPRNLLALGYQEVIERRFISAENLEPKYLRDFIPGKTKVFFDST